MTITHSEIVGSRRGGIKENSDSEIEYVYHVRGTDDLTAAFTHIHAVAPATIVDPATGWTLIQTGIDWDHVGAEAWKFNYRYAGDDRTLDTGDYRFSFSTTGQTAHIKSCKQDVATYVPPNKQAANYNHRQLIGANDGEVAGVDIVVPCLRLTLSYRQPKAVITDTYVRLLELMTGTYNNATFFGRAAGEVLFLGADGYQGNKTDPQIDYQFLRLPNVTGLTIGTITGIAKLGHHYLWVEYEDDPQSRMLKKPAAVHVCRVYESSNFSMLGVGT